MVSRLEGILLLGEKAWPKRTPTKEQDPTSRTDRAAKIYHPSTDHFTGRRAESQNGPASVLQCNSPDEGQGERSSQSKWVIFYFAMH
jgi:hypothetical protein